MAVDTLNSWLEDMAGALRFLLEGVSVVCVAIGFLTALGESLRLLGRSQSQGPRLNRIRLRFGSWLSMALEYQLAADIVATTTVPSGDNLIKLAAVAVIRTFLNVFLGREVEAEQKLEDARRERMTNQITTHE
jgi:uncharacterized membrane protein